jgi:hypothetical protein
MDINNIEAWVRKEKMRYAREIFEGIYFCVAFILGP